MAFDLEEMITRAVATNNTKLLQEIRSLVREELLRCSQENPHRLVSAKEAGEILDMSEAAVRKAAERGQLPAQRVGRRLRFRVGDLLSTKRK